MLARRTWQNSIASRSMLPSVSKNSKTCRSFSAGSVQPITSSATRNSCLGRWPDGEGHKHPTGGAGAPEGRGG